MKGFRNFSVWFYNGSCDHMCLWKRSVWSLMLKFVVHSRKWCCLALWHETPACTLQWKLTYYEANFGNYICSNEAPFVQAIIAYDGFNLPAKAVFVLAIPYFKNEFFFSMDSITLSGGYQGDIIKNSKMVANEMGDNIFQLQMV